jgi:phage host-nuclease inhibitor protein Gam
VSATEELPLADYLVEPFAAADLTEGGPWRISDVGSAEWVALKLRDARRQQADARVEYETWKSRADEWLAARLAPLERDIQWAEAQLTEWHRHLREEDASNKTITLPLGTKLVSRAGQPRVTVVDEERFLDWAKANWPELVRTKESANLQELRKQLKESGEAIPGVEVAAPEVSFSVEVPE